MITLLVEDTERMLNEMKLIDEFKIEIDYSHLIMLNKLIQEAKHYVDKLSQTHSIKEKSHV